MGARMRALDWAHTPVGPVTQWPQSLKTAVQILLGSRYPMFVWWGQAFTNLYNDAYAPMLGGRHPHALGQSAPQVWADVWEVVGPQATAVLYEGRSSWNEERLLIMERYGYPEETYFTFSYSPVADDTGGVGGVFCAVTEDTARVLGQRRLRTLRELAASTVGAMDATEVCRRAATVLSDNPYDLPFVLLYLFDSTGAGARLAGTAGVVAEVPGAPPVIDLRQEADSPWLLRRVIEAGAPICLENIERQVGVMPSGPWPISPSQALLLPLAQAGQDQLAGILIAGVSPLRPLDEEYRGFCSLVATSIATAIADARAYESERQRAEALAELDRAKTTFFSNISHEFRTPLTLMLGPLEQMLEAEDGAFMPSLREELVVVHRNGLRLLKLVNTLLDFARIEAGRIDASYEPLDLATCTADLASVFRAAIERAGLRLVVDCPRLPEAVYVDREMWEKIVLNLLANALKFTFTGEITVRLQWGEDHVVLTVCDTGTGIPGHELPHLFERFHRIRDARARTHEGTGIGLALVQELVHLHSGEITVVSEVDVGTTFTVTIPTGTAHLPANRVGVARRLPSTALGAEPYVEEALYWQPMESAGQSDVDRQVPHALASPLPSALASACILLVDDNVDMRAYVQRLLSPHWQVEAVADGLQALAAVRERLPDLVLADVMMPGLDGLALLRALRADPRTATIPVILLSARAGEASRVEGLEAGADDYLVKPFSARELLARIEGHLNLARLRNEMQATLRDLNTTLAQRVAERTAALEQAYDDLRREMAERQRMQETLLQQEKLAALGTLLANVAHELNNPLAVATMQLDTLYEARDPGTWTEELEILRQAIERCQGVVQSFLSLVRHHEPTRRAVTLQTLMSDVLVLLERALEADGITVERLLADDLPPLWVDPHQLQHVLANLLTNAHHALRQSTPPRHLRLTAAATADRSQVILEVADSGPGIPQEVQRRVFEPFFTTKPQGMGSGLGLPLCRSIVENHGGTIQISSQPGHGTTVSVTLPVAAPEVPLPEAGPEPEEPAQRQRGTILLIDDEPGVQRALQRLLQRSGHEITTATNGQEGLAALEARAFEVILCDMRMPDLDGPGFYRELARRYPHLQSRIVFLTGDVLSPEAQAFFAHVDRPRLVKPFRAQKVRQVIQQVLAAQ
jgi:signal transduction histidine kinase